MEAAKADGRWEKAYRVGKTEPPEDLIAAIRADPKALATYATLTSQNRFALTFRTLSLKTADGRKKRIAAFVEMLKKGETIHPQAKRPPKATSGRRGKAGTTASSAS